MSDINQKNEFLEPTIIIFQMNNQEIGKNAGLVWQILDNNGEMQINELWNQSELSLVDFNLALGWLARENKILFYEKDSQELDLTYLIKTL